jgi:predicted DCC family thiol-disulfide oxidoreductase YuxK
VKPSLTLDLESHDPTSLGRWMRGLTLDLRSLALFRIAFGSCLLMDLLLRIPQIDNFYTDKGVLPRDLLVRELGDAWVASLHLMSGQWAVQLALFLVAVVFALGFIAGYRTRLCAIASWLLLTSMQVRNPTILHGGDTLLRVMLFWCMFAPLNGRCSLDRALNPEDPPLPSRQFSPATLVILFQICAVYLFAFADKMHPVWLTERSAVYYALNLDIFATSFGHWLLGHPALLRAATTGTLLLEGFGPILALSPFLSDRLRLLAVVSFIGFHAGLAISMRLALFPWTCAAVWLALLPATFWDGLTRRFAGREPGQLRVYFDGNCEFCRKALLVGRELLLLRDVELWDAHADPALAAVMGEDNSWFVQDSKGATHHGYKALVELVRASPMVGWTAPLLGAASLRPIGEWSYHWVANHQAEVSRLMERMTPPRPRDTIPLPANLLLVACFMLLAWGLSFGPDIVRPDSVSGIYRARLASMTSLGQRWTLFSPYPMLDDGWFVIEGVRRKGGRVDVWSGNGKPTEAKPVDFTRVWPNTQWVKYLVTIIQTGDSEYRVYFGRYLCRTWNQRHAAPDQVGAVNVSYMIEPTPPPGKPIPTPRKVPLFRHDCADTSAHR